MLLSSGDIKINKVSENGSTGVFSFEPLPKGFGHTLGNTLRRVLLSSLKGAAVTQIKLEGALHQFTTISGVKEDVVEMGLNFKQVRAKLHGEYPVVGRISATGPGVVTAGDIEIASDVEIVNKDLHLVTLADKKTKFEAEVVFEPGVGYSPVEERETPKIGVIVLDAMYSPVIYANYEVEQTRKGTIADLDKLVVTVTTDGSLLPSEAMTQAATLLRDFFKRFAMGEDKEEAAVPAGVENISSSSVDAKKVSVEELPLPTRTVNALKKAGINTLSELAGKTDEDLADVKNLGEKSVQEIKKLLEKEGLVK
ncbi:DNA-directed RNA polymerase subunit alpha [candidate division WWE3 bacterium]|nr:DNA-directed RNA polymerase subunit alpha [candidate division WWE3 bacterium]